MGTPNVNITKSDGNTGVVSPSTTGVLAIIAFMTTLPANVATSFTRQADALAAGGIGPGLEYGSYYLANGKKPILLINPTCTTAGAYGTIDVTKVTGTSVVTTTGAPNDEYDVLVKVVAGGTIGVAGITYTYSFDNGVNTSPVQALGTASTMSLSIIVPAAAGASGVEFALAAGTLIAGDSWRVQTTRPKMQNSDLVTALEALRTTTIPWDNVLIDTDASSTMVATVDQWLAGLEGRGVYKMAWMNTRRKNMPAPGTESESAFQTSMSTLLNTTSTIRIDVGCDGGDCPSLVTGILQWRPTSLAIATRANPAAVGIDPAWLQQPAIPGYKITDAVGNPKWHDEEYFPGIDGLRLSTLRSVPGSQGVYITNANILSASGSDYVYDQHARTMNVACSITFQQLTKQLSRGVRKGEPQANGQVYILDQDASSIEGFVNPQLSNALENQVTDVAMQLSRTDDISSNRGATINAEVDIESLAYIKQFNVTTKFVKSISRTVTVPLAA
jgi:hypothetical protein